MTKSRSDGCARSRRILAGASGTAAVGLVWALTGCATGQEPDPARAASSTPVNASPDATGSDGTAEAGGDTYRVSGEDNTPAGPEPFEVEVALDGDTITALTFTPQATNSESNRFQRIFAKQISDQVVGKTLEEARAVHVSGASLTSEGFAEALARIEQQAG